MERSLYEDNSTFCLRAAVPAPPSYLLHFFRLKGEDWDMQLPENGKRRDLKQLHLSFTHEDRERLILAYITFLHRRLWKSGVTYAATTGINEEIVRVMGCMRSLNLRWECLCNNS